MAFTSKILLLFLAAYAISRVMSADDYEYDYDDTNDTSTKQVPNITSKSASTVTPGVSSSLSAGEPMTSPPNPPPSNPPKDTNSSKGTLFEPISGYGTLIQAACSGGKCGQPLFLTPYIQSNDIATAVGMAKVTGHPVLESVRSYSGYLTVNETARSNVFFWFIPALDSETSSPIIVWLQGGPGQSGLFGLFNLHGPFEMVEPDVAAPREFTWAASLNMLYIDNPVGVGFSFTEDKTSYPKNEEQIAENLYVALNQFFELFPDYRDDHIYICGEGFGAKFAVALAHKIHEMGRDTVFNLKGIALGNPKLDQETMVDQGQYYYELGLIDEQELNGVTHHLQQANYAIHHYSWADAMNNIEQIFGTPYEKPIDKEFYVPELTGYSSDLNILQLEEPQHFSSYLTFVNQPEVRKALHVGAMAFQDGRLAYHALREDLPQSAKNSLSILLDNYRVLFYGGNLDAKVPYSMALEILHKIHWRHLDDYKNVSRFIWKVERQDRDVAGYVHHVKNFFEVMIRNAGHSVAYDQPRATLDMMNRFIWGRAFIVNQRQ